MPLFSFGSSSSVTEEQHVSPPAPVRSDAHSPTQVNRVPPYLAINPGLFDSVDHWSYRDLQKLAKRLGLSASGKREDVVERLKTWHREQRTSGQVGHFHAVQVRATPEGKAISPRLLSPLVQSARGSHHKRGILSSSKKTSARCSFGSDNSVAESPRPLQQRSGVLFSPVRTTPDEYSHAPPLPQRVQFFLPCKQTQPNPVFPPCWCAVQYGQADSLKGTQ
jgi:hypothetical protein